MEKGTSMKPLKQLQKEKKTIIWNAIKAVKETVEIAPKKKGKKTNGKK